MKLARDTWLIFQRQTQLLLRNPVWIFVGVFQPVMYLLLAYLMLALIALMTSAVSYGIALKVKSEDALAPLMNTVAQPVLLLSGILLPLAFAPAWLKRIADWNPFSWAVDGTRALFNGDIGNGVVWQALLIMTVLTVLAVMWAAREFARSVR